MTQHDMIS